MGHARSAPSVSQRAGRGTGSMDPPDSISVPVPTTGVVNSGGGPQISCGKVMPKMVREEICHTACPERPEEQAVG